MSESELELIDEQFARDDIPGEPRAGKYDQALGSVLGAVDSVLGTSSAKYFVDTGRGGDNYGRTFEFTSRDPDLNFKKAQILRQNISEFFPRFESSLQAVSKAQDEIQSTRLRDWAEEGVQQLSQRSKFDTTKWDDNGVKDLKDCLDGMNSIEASITKFVHVVKNLKTTEVNIMKTLASPYRPKLSSQSKSSFDEEIISDSESDGSSSLSDDSDEDE